MKKPLRTATDVQHVGCGPERLYLILHAEEKLPSYIPEEMETVVLPENPPRPPKSVWATIYIGKGKERETNRIDIAGFLYKKEI